MNIIRQNCKTDYFTCSFEIKSNFLKCGDNEVIALDNAAIGSRTVRITRPPDPLSDSL
jgi:hypothetical protein